jgi:peptidyl-prolyl cis-trans isomerase C
MKHRQIAVGLTASLLLLTACGQAGTPGAAESGPAAVTVNGQAISASVFDLYIGTVSQQPAESIPAEQKDQMLDQLVAMHLAADAAQKAGLDKGKDVLAQLELTRMNVLADAQFKKMLADTPVTDADVQAEYDTQVAAMPKAGGTEYNASHILVDSKTTADAIVAELKKGGDFAKIAKERSKDGSKDNGGNLGWFTPETMVKPFADAVVALQKGKYTESPVESQFGWHVILLHDSRAGSPPPPPPALADVRDQVVQLVQRKRLQTYLENLRKAAKIQKTG